MESMRALFERESDQENPWTGYSPSLGRPLLNTAKFLTPKTAPGRELATAVERETLTLPGLELAETSDPTPVAVQPPVKT
jgi:hypothetical protein